MLPAVMGKKTKQNKDKDDALDGGVYPPGTLSLRKTRLDARVADKAVAEKELTRLQRTLAALQVRCWLEKRRAVFVFEGWDAAGKGTAIKHLTALMDPRGYKVWPLAAPAEEERAHHYLWRFATRMPPAGTLAVFDRSWYGRVLVERVEGFCTEKEWRRAYAELNAFERMHTDDGVVLVKFFLHVDAATQFERFKQREKDPLKHFKLGDDDWRSRKRRDEYETAYQDMLDRTHRPDAPWVIVPATDKRLARRLILQRCIDALDP